VRRCTILLLACSVYGADVPKLDVPKLAEPYRSVADLALAAPPEIAADALLRLAESGKIPDRTAKLNLIEEAFRLAASAQLQTPMRGLAGLNADSRAGSLARAHRLKLDALSLESRAVRDMAPLDPGHARQLFTEIAQPSPAPLTCADALVYDFSGFYETLSLVVRDTFPAGARAKQEHLHFLLSYVARAASPLQLAPLARAIQSAGLSGDERGIAVARFNAVLGSMAVGGREFAAALPDLRQQIQPDMAEAFTAFERRGKAGAQCKEPQGAEAETNPYWQSAEAKQILSFALKLRYSSAGSVVSADERATKEWDRQLADFLKEFAQWAPGQETSEADFYHQKSLVYEALLDLTPPGGERRKLLADFTAFVASSNLQRQSPAEWFMHAAGLFDRARDGGHGSLSAVLEAYRSSASPALVLFANLEDAVGSKRPAWIPAQP
jgi:hypothetical protein